MTLQVEHHARAAAPSREVERQVMVAHGLHLAEERLPGSIPPRPHEPRRDLPAGETEHFRGRPHGMVELRLE